MKHTKKLSAIILSAVMLTTACSGNTSPDSSTQIKDSDPAASENAGTDDSADSADSSNDTVSASKSVKDVIGDIKVDTKVKFLGWYDLNNGDVAGAYKELFGVPPKNPEGYEKDNSGNDTEPFIDVYLSSYVDRYYTLEKLIKSGDSPDAFPAEISRMPCSVGADKLFQPIGDIIDFETEEFAPYSKIQQSLKYIGNDYVPIFSSTPHSLLWYRSSVIKEAGLEDPWELYEKNEWTWSKFLSMCESFSDSEEKKYGVDGYFVERGILATTGKGIIGIEDGLLKSNADDEKIISAMDFLRQFATSQKNLRYPKEEENNWSPSYSEWANGNTLFYQDGLWRYDETWRLYKKKNEWSDDEINFIPFPRCDDEQSYYQEYNCAQDTYMLPIGSKNTEGYKALVYSAAYLYNDSSAQTRLSEEKKTEYDWNDRLLDRMDKINRPDSFEWVVDCRDYFREVPPTALTDVIVDRLSESSYVHGKDYRTFITEERPDIIKELDKATDSINKSAENIVTEQ